MKYIIILLLLVTSAWSQTISNYAVDGQTHSTARVKFTKSDTTTAVYVMVGVNPPADPCAADTANYRIYNATFSQAAANDMLIPVTGLNPSTTFKWAVCRTSDNVRLGASTADIVTTAEPAIHPAYPTSVTPPSAHQTIPTTFVGGDYLETSCANFQTRINTESAVAGRTDHTRIRLATAAGSCGNITVTTARGAGSTGWILITPENHASLPPWGSQVLNNDSNKMGTIAGTWTVSSSKIWVRGFNITGPATGSLVQMVTINSGASDIVFQHNVINRAYNATHTTRAAFRVEGATNFSMLDNYLEVTRGTGQAYCLVQEGTGSNGIWFRNNYMNCPGNSIYFENHQSLDTAIPQNIIVENNILNWNEKYRLGSATFENQAGTWQGIEFKQGQNIRIQGNRIINMWPGQDDFNYFLFIAPRVATCGFGTGVRAVSDVEVSYNMGMAGAGIHISGFVNDPCAGRNAIPLPSNKIWIHDNIWTRLRPDHIATGGNTNRLQMMTVWGVEDLRIENNALGLGIGVGETDNRQTSLRFDCGPIEGFVYSNNIIRWANAVNSGGLAYVGSGPCVWSAGGSAPANTGPAKDLMDVHLYRLGSGASYSVTNNFIAPENPTGNGFTNATISAANWFPSGQFFPGTEGSPASLAGFVNASDLASEDIRNFCLNEFTSANRNRATDGRWLGPNCVKLQEKLGGVYNLVVSARDTTTATVQFVAPGGLTGPGTACRVDVSTDNTFPVGSTSSFTATVNSAIPWSQTANITGLSTGTLYYAMPRCAGILQTVSFKTR